MTEASTRGSPTGRLLGPRRLLGVDVARGVALIGMMSVHIVPALDPDGAVSWAYRISSGRASALFAILAGLSLVLANLPRGGEPLEPGAGRGVMARAALIAGVGLFLGTLGSGVAVILVHYAVLFAIGTMFMGLGARALMVTGAGWLLLIPVAAHLLRPFLPPGPGSSPSLVSLAHPVELVTTSPGHRLLPGPAMDRVPARRDGPGSVAASAHGDRALAADRRYPARCRDEAPLSPAARACRWLRAAHRAALLGARRPRPRHAAADRYVRHHPSTSWWWLAVSAPHSGAPLDLLHTTGTALAVIGGCLLLAAALHGRWRWLVLPLAAAGSMTLTLYTLHVVALAAVRGAVANPEVSSPTVFWTFNAIFALVLASAWQFTGRRGPLEAIAADMSAAARQSGTPPSLLPPPVIN